MGELKVLTVRQLAEHIASQINLEDVMKTEFPTCDFGLIDTDGETVFDQEELEFLHSGVCGWYGIKNVDTGFDSYVLVLIADYYGGSCAELTQIYDGISLKDAENEICRIILNSLKHQEEADETTLMVVEFGGGSK